MSAPTYDTGSMAYIPQIEDTILREFRWRSGRRSAHPATPGSLSN